MEYELEDLARIPQWALTDQQKMTLAGFDDEDLSHFELDAWDECKKSWLDMFRDMDFDRIRHCAREWIFGYDPEMN